MSAKKIVPQKFEDLDETLTVLMEQLRKELRTIDSKTVGGKLKRFKIRNVIQYLANAKLVLEA